MTQQTEARHEPAKKPASSRWVKLGFICLIVAIMAVVSYVQLKDPVLKGWGTDWDKAVEQAQTKGVNIIAMVTSSPMRHMDKRMIKENMHRPSVVSALEQIGYVKVHLNTADHGELAKKHGVGEKPAFLIIDSGGKLLKSQEGLVNDATFIHVFLGVTKQRPN